MSRAVSYLVVAVVAFFLGGFAFRYLVGAEQGKADRQAVPAPSAENAGTRQFAVEGMTCEGCVNTITQALKAVPGVRSATVSLADKRAVVDADPAQVPTERIIAAITEAGYKAVPAAAEKHQPASAMAGGKQPVLVNITRGKEALHAVSMGIGLAQSALKTGRPATVFLNAESPVLAAKNLPDDVQFADFPPVRKMLGDLVAAGGQVLVCRHCAHVCKLNEADLMEGAVLADHEKLFSAMAPGTVVFSY